MTRNRLYSLLGVLCAAGYSWLFFVVFFRSDANFTLCLIKLATGYPCPSCGSTRGVMHLMHGDFPKALMLNPLSVVVAVCMMVLPVWLMVDVATRGNSLHRSYLSSESFFRKKAVIIAFVLLILANWIWNLNKF